MYTVHRMAEVISTFALTIDDARGLLCSAAYPSTVPDLRATAAGLYRVRRRGRTIVTAADTLILTKIVCLGWCVGRDSRASETDLN